MKKNIISMLCAIFCGANVMAQSWPVASQEAKAGTRWWWMGSAVDEDNLRWSMYEYSKAGIQC